jgi:hypothetical protein
MWWLQQRYAGKAVDAASKQGVKLDYSLDSLADLEMVLAQLNDRYAESGNDAGVCETALQYAAYIVTVLEKHYGKGAWADEDANHAESSYAFVLQGVTIFPVGWCLKRILDGPSEDITTKLRVCTRHMKRVRA